LQSYISRFFDRLRMTDEKEAFTCHCEERSDVAIYSLSLGRKGGQASSEDLLPLGYGERDRIKVRVKPEILISKS
jgi:hypothetical protein